MPSHAATVTSDPTPAVAASPASRPVPDLAAVPGPADVEVTEVSACVTVAVDEERACVVRLRGSLGRNGVARVEAVLQALESVSRTLVVDLARARTGDRRLLRILAEVATRRHRAGHRVCLRGVHPDALPDLDGVTLVEAFLVYQAVCRAPGGAPVDRAS